MDNVIHLDEYIDATTNSEESSVMNFPWDGEEFKVFGNSYLDRAKEPPIKSHHSINEFRNILMDLIPHRVTIDGQFRPMMNTMYMPFTFDGDPYWVMGGVQKTMMNHPYEPFAALMLVIRDYPQDLFDMINGVVVESEGVYESYKRKFNKHFLRLLNNRGNGDNNMASEDEMIRLGALFMVLLTCASHHEGLVLDSDRRFENAWCGRNKIVSWNFKDLLAYSRKLKNTYESGLTWEQFYHRYMWESDEDSLWFFNLPSIVSDRNNLHPEFTQEELYKLLGDVGPTISMSGGRLMIVCKLTENIQKKIKNHFHFSQVGEESFKNQNLFFFPNFYPSNYFSGNYCVFTNYSPSESTGFQTIRR